MVCEASVWLCLVLFLVHGADARRGRGRRPAQETQPWLPHRFVQQKQQEIKWTHVSPEGGDAWWPLEFSPPRRAGEEASWLPQRQHTQQQHPWLLQDHQELQVIQTDAQRPHHFAPAPGSCQVDVDAVPVDHVQPMVVDAEQQVVYPDLVGAARLLVLPPGSRVTLACPGTKLALTGRSYLYLTCTNGDLIHGRSNKRVRRWAELGCVDKPKPTLKAGGPCGRNGTTHTIGWHVRRGVYLPQITVCFNEHLETSIFANHVIQGRYIDAKVIETSRPSFKTHDVFSVSVNRSYRKKEQRARTARLLDTDEHLTGKGQHYLARGHLAPDADFVLEAEQDATYYYVNVVPQWQAVNNGNWKQLEEAVRGLAECRGTALHVWTGTHGTLELPTPRHRPVPLYLADSDKDSAAKKVLPVPALLWKVIYDPSRQQAAGVVVVNDVRGQGTAASWSLTTQPCPDLCRSLPWVDWDTSDLAHGLTFCCSLSALKQIITDLPDLGSTSLLRC